MPPQHPFIRCRDVLFGLLRAATPTANNMDIKLAMFADDLTVWMTGNSIERMAGAISEFIGGTVDPWATSHNMILSNRNATRFSSQITLQTLNLRLHCMVLNYHTVWY